MIKIYNYYGKFNLVTGCELINGVWIGCLVDVLVYPRPKALWELELGEPRDNPDFSCAVRWVNCKTLDDTVELLGDADAARLSVEPFSNCCRCFWRLMGDIGDNKVYSGLWLPSESSLGKEEGGVGGNGKCCFWAFESNLMLTFGITIRWVEVAFAFAFAAPFDKMICCDLSKLLLADDEDD